MLWIRQQVTSSNVIKLHVEEEKVILNDKEYLLADIKSRSDFRPFVRYIFPLKQTNDVRTIKDEFGGSHWYPYGFKVMEAFSHSANSKNTPGEIAEFSLYHMCAGVSFVFYPESTNFKDALCIVETPMDKNTPFEVTTLKDGEIVQYNADEAFLPDFPKNHFLPKCELTASSNIVGQGGIQVDFQYKDVSRNIVPVPSFYATVKSDKGYISHRKFHVVDGKGSFRFYPLGLTSQEISTIQVGIGKFTDVASIHLTVE